MIPHPSDAELRQFRQSGLPPDLLLQVDDHLAECEDCRRRAAELGNAAARIGELGAQLRFASRHLSDEDVQALVREERPTERRTEALEHLRVCATCAAHVEDVRLWQTREAPKASLWRAAVAAALLLAALSAAFWWTRARGASTDRSLAGIDLLSPDQQAQVRAGLAAGTVTLPAFVTDLNGSREVLMGAPAAPTATFALASPLGTGIASDRPQFEWRPLAGADRYVVTVFDERANEVTRSQPTSELTWTPAQPLARDRTYIWQVTATHGAETIVAPAAPAPPARFHVIDGKTAGMLRRLEADRPTSHLLLGVLNAQAGVIDAAVEHLERVPETDPNAATARRLVDALNAARPRPR